MTGFIDENQYACLFFFEYDKNRNKNNLIKQMDPFQLKKEDTTYRIGNQGISCEMMTHSEKGEILVCFLLSQINPNEMTAKYIDPNSYNFVDLPYISK